MRIWWKRSCVGPIDSIFNLNGSWCLSPSPSIQFPICIAPVTLHWGGLPGLQAPGEAHNTNVVLVAHATKISIQWELPSVPKNSQHLWCCTRQFTRPKALLQLQQEGPHFGVTRTTNDGNHGKDIVKQKAAAKSAGTNATFWAYVLDLVPQWWELKTTTSGRVHRILNFLGRTIRTIPCLCNMNLTLHCPSQVHDLGLKHSGTWPPIDVSWCCLFLMQSRRAQRTCFWCFSLYWPVGTGDQNRMSYFQAGMSLQPGSWEGRPNQDQFLVQYVHFLRPRSARLEYPRNDALHKEFVLSNPWISAAGLFVNMSPSKVLQILSSVKHKKGPCSMCSKHLFYWCFPFQYLGLIKARSVDENRPGVQCIGAVNQVKHASSFKNSLLAFHTLGLQHYALCFWMLL